MAENGGLPAPMFFREPFNVFILRLEVVSVQSFKGKRKIEYHASRRLRQTKSEQRASHIKKRARRRPTSVGRVLALLLIM